MPSPPPRILIVDDDPLAIQVLNQALAGFGDVRFACGGLEALSVLASQPFDLALLDAQMPIMDGYDTCRAIKRDYPDVTVIFVTASSDPESEILALDVGAVDFITKPINPPVVRARVTTQLKLKKQADELRALAKSDPLTGIANRRALEELANLEWRRSLRNRSPLAVLMIDIDQFKPYNDCYGHLEGDACLRRVAQAIAESVTRAGDLVARFGGEEFAVLLPESTEPQTVIVAEKIRQAVRALAIPHAQSTAADRVTVSIGAAVGIPRFPPDAADPPVGLEGDYFEPQNLEALFNRADLGLYAAKQAGRDCVVLQPQFDTPEPDLDLSSAAPAIPPSH